MKIKLIAALFAILNVIRLTSINIKLTQFDKFSDGFETHVH